jgi:hypothetical protein
MGASAPSSVFTGAISTLTNLTARMRSTLSPLLRDSQELATFHAQLDTIGSATSLVRTPISMASQLGSIFDGLVTGIRLPRLGVDALLHIYDFPSVVSSAYPSATTITTARGRVNTAAVDTFVRRLAIIGGTRLSVDATTVDEGGYDSYDDAVTVRRRCSRGWTSMNCVRFLRSTAPAPWYRTATTTRSARCGSCARISRTPCRARRTTCRGC